MGNCSQIQMQCWIPPTTQMCVLSLNQEDPFEKEMATHSSILAWEIPRTEELSRLTVHGIAESDIT